MLSRARHLLSLCLIVFSLFITQAGAQTSPSGWLEMDVLELPAEFSGNLITLTPITLEGDTLRFFSDTGGGANMISTAAFERLGLDVHGEVPGEGGMITLTGMPVFNPGDAIPSPNLLPPASWQLMVAREWPDFVEAEGFLGRTWFAGRIWLFDYPGETIAQVMGIDYSAVPDAHRVRLGFQKDDRGRRTTHFPRLTIEVEGEELDMLFDTGAQVVLTEEARELLAAGTSGHHATTFIAESVFERWRDDYPDWRVIEDGDAMMNAHMIEVPEVTIAGHTVGPVWFTVRPDVNLHEHLSQWMDRRIDGALGGSALKYFRLIVDYPNGTAVFDVVEGAH